MEFEGRARIGGHFDIAPLVDVVFLLLLFFLLTSTYAARAVLEVDVPSSATSAPARETALEIVLTAAGEVRLDGATVTLEALPAAARSRLDGRADRSASVRADADTAVERLVAVLDVLRAAGATDLALVTRPRAEP